MITKNSVQVVYIYILNSYVIMYYTQVSLTVKSNLLTSPNKYRVLVVFDDWGTLKTYKSSQLTVVPAFVVQVRENVSLLPTRCTLKAFPYKKKNIHWFIFLKSVTHMSLKFTFYN